MPLNLFLSTILSSVEHLLNQALSLDSSSKAKLSRLCGKRFAIECTFPALTFYISVLENGFLLSAFNSDVDDEENIDARITGSSSSLLHLLFATDKRSTLQSSDIELRGDVTGIQELQEMLLTLNIDWEYQLSKIVGDVPTQTLSESLGLLSTFIKTSSAKINGDIKEYIHEESNLVPSRHELESFYQRIAALRLRLDRSHARMDHIIKIN